MKYFYVSRRFLKSFYIICILSLSLLILVLSQHFQLTSESEEKTSAPMEAIAVQEPIQPIPIHSSLNKKRVALGDKLFHDPQLSHNNTISCASCHSLSTGGVDRLVRSIGINGAEGSVNAPTVFNSGFNFKQNWDGRSETLEDQIESTLKNPISMGSDWPEVISKLKDNPEYVKAFNQSYSDGMRSANIKDAIATFERSLSTPNSRFDKFLRGDSQAITAGEKEGYRLFKTYGCVSCHQGVNVGGNLFQKFGIMRDYFGDRGNETKADRGRFNITGNPEDLHVFKVPGLRNIALTPPYFHDSSTKTLEEAIAIMAKYQLGIDLSAEEINLIEQFLSALTGEYQGKPL